MAPILNSLEFISATEWFWWFLKEGQTIGLDPNKAALKIKNSY